MILVTDNEHHIVDTNERAHRILDTDAGELLGTPLEEVLAILPDSGETTDGGSSDIVPVTIDSEEKLYEVRKSEIRDAADTQLGHVYLLSDVTTERRRKRQLAHQNRELERQNERLDKFASVISHDLRNPLSVAQLRLDLVQQEVETEHAEEIGDALDRMETMIHEILTMARADTVVEETESIRLQALVQAAWSTVETDGGELELDIPENATIEGNWSLLRNTLENLFRNALEHNEPPVRVRVGTQRASAGPVGLFYIEDDGVGIPEDERDDVFEFGHTSSDNGTGFGLAIVDELVRAHGWTITITEGERGGARFEIATGASTR
jgi:signal transduction histidine kinase